MAKEEKKKKKGNGGFVGKLMGVLPYVLVVVLGSGGGLMAAKLAGGDDGKAKDEEEFVDPVPGEGNPDDDLTNIDFGTVTATLKPDGSSPRYIRLTLSLAVRPGDVEKVQALIDKRKPELESRLTGYLSGLGMKEVYGPTNKNRMQREIMDDFNQRLFPNGKFLIRRAYLPKVIVE